MGKYFSVTGKAAAPIMSRGCGNLEDGAYANDTIGEGCWALHGSPIIIGSSFASYQAGFEKINSLFKVDSTQNPLPTYIYLNAAKV